jgi:hypothetical protein
MQAGRMMANLVLVGAMLVLQPAGASESGTPESGTPNLGATQSGSRIGHPERSGRQCEVSKEHIFCTSGNPYRADAE